MSEFDFNFIVPGTIVATGKESTDYSAHEFGAAVEAGHGFEFGAFTVTPYAGLNFVHTDIEGSRENGSALFDFPVEGSTITEGGPTGLELIFEDDRRNSLETTLGIGASTSFRLDSVVVVPQLRFDWHHEMLDNQRTIGVRFAQDFRDEPGRFEFATEPPDRNWFELGGAVSFALENGLQPFVSAQTLLGHRYLDSTSVFVGVRMAID